MCVHLGFLPCCISALVVPFVLDHLCSPSVPVDDTEFSYSDIHLFPSVLSLIPSCGPFICLYIVYIISKWCYCHKDNPIAFRFPAHLLPTQDMVHLVPDLHEETLNSTSAEEVKLILIILYEI